MSWASSLGLNKSVQAQSTDIQPAIRARPFEHPLSDLQQLSGREMERLGRLKRRSTRPPGRPLHAGRLGLRHLPRGRHDSTPRRPTGSSSTLARSSNEAGFVFQLLARAWGTNNVNTARNYAIRPPARAFRPPIGKGTSSIELED